MVAVVVEGSEGLKEGKKNLISAKRALLAMAVASACAHGASASIITLSEFSSEPGIDPSELAATLDFQVAGNFLTLTVTNDTPSPIDEYNMNQIFFNASAAVSNLAVSVFPTEWLLDTTGTMVDGWGVFDFKVFHGHEIGNPHHLIQSGAFETFVFSFVGVGITENDFVLELSDVSGDPGNMPMFAAAKFVQGPNDDSAFGAVPEPGVLALLAIAGLVGARRRRRSTA